MDFKRSMVPALIINEWKVLVYIRLQYVKDARCKECITTKKMWEYGRWTINLKIPKKEKRTAEQEEQLNINITVTTVNGNDSKKRHILFKMDFLKT